MNQRAIAFLAAAVAASCLLTLGCAGRPAGPPGWVRVVPTRIGERAYYVGGLSAAPDAETGIEMAEADALARIEEDARPRFIGRLDKALQQSGIETTSVERLGFRTEGVEIYLDYLSEAARRDSVYYRPCTPVDLGGREPDEGAVCQIFVLLSLGDGDWERQFVEAVMEIKRRRLHEGKQHLAEIADWMLDAR